MTPEGEDAIVAAGIEAVRQGRLGCGDSLEDLPSEAAVRRMFRHVLALREVGLLLAA